MFQEILRYDETCLTQSWCQVQKYVSLDQKCIRIHVSGMRTEKEEPVLVWCWVGGCSLSPRVSVCLSVASQRYPIECLW